MAIQRGEAVILGTRRVSAADYAALRFDLNVAFQNLSEQLGEQDSALLGLEREILPTPLFEWKLASEPSPRAGNVVKPSNCLAEVDLERYVAAVRWRIVHKASKFLDFPLRRFTQISA